MVLKFNKQEKGFTLVEVLISIVILGVVIGVTTPSLARSLAKRKLSTAATQLKADIRYTRQIAITERRARAIKFYVYERSSEPNVYEIFRNADPLKKVHLPENIKLIYCNFAADRLTFTNQGNPQQGGTITLENQYCDKLYVITLPITGRVRIDDTPPENWGQ